MLSVRIYLRVTGSIRYRDKGSMGDKVGGDSDKGQGDGEVRGHYQGQSECHGQGWGESTHQGKAGQCNRVRPKVRGSILLGLRVRVRVTG